MRLAPEGRPFVLGAAVVLAALVVTALALGGGPWFLLAAGWLPVAAWVPYFFRDPVRDGPRGPNAVIAPADGRVVSVTAVDEPDLMGGPALRISIFMNVFDVHVNRHPVDGTVVRRVYHAGRFLNASLDKASVHNERMTLVIETPCGRVAVRQIAGLIARRIVTDPAEGAAVRQGDRLGIIRFGSRVDTFLPAGAQPRVAVGDRTRAGVDVIAEWP